MDQYKKTNMFANNWDEFDESRDVLVDLIDEYRAAESKDYVVRSSSFSLLRFLFLFFCRLTVHGL